MKECYLCGKGTLVRKKVPYELYGELVGHYIAEVCSMCGEVFFDEETSRRITAATKSKGLWGIGSRTKIGAAGSTLDIRLPQRIIRFLELKKGEEVTIYPESKHRLIVEV